MKGRKSWIFTIFSIVVIVSIAIALVLLNKYQNNNSGNEQNHDSNNSNNSEVTETYASSFSLNSLSPSTIEIFVGTKVRLLDNFVIVNPSNMITKLTFEITPKSSGVINGIEFANNTITANFVGDYTIIFKMPKSKVTYFTETINIVVYEEKENSHIQQINNTITIGENNNITSMFLIKSNETLNVETDEKIRCLNNDLIAVSVGESVIKFTFIENMVEYYYEFTIKIKDTPMYQIILNNVTNNTINLDLIENDIKTINYSIKNRYEEFVTQEIVITIEDENVVVIERITDPLIKIRAVNKGETKIKISLVSDLTIHIEIYIVVN